MVETQTLLRVQPRDDFIISPSIEAVTTRAMAYLEAGYPVHFRGPTGTGKTTLALHLAKLRNRPVILMYGDEEFGSSDLVGGEKGVVSRRLVDNFIHSVLKTEESVRPQWIDQRLTTACRYGYTLIYDEFSRSRPEANNVLLAVFEEKLLSLPETRYGESYMRVHPEFRAVFTSNPEEYAGIHKTQDALLDRMVTIKLTHYDRGTEIAITRAKSGIGEKRAEKIVDIVRDLRKMSSSSWPSIRACIMIAKLVMQRRGKVRADNSIFCEICFDVLGSNGLKQENIRQLIETKLR